MITLTVRSKPHEVHTTSMSAIRPIKLIITAMHNNKLAAQVHYYVDKSFSISGP